MLTFLKNTNVIKLYNHILKEDEDNQKTWYNSGIGTDARPSWKMFSHMIDQAIAWCAEWSLHRFNFLLPLSSSRNFNPTVLGAYSWLSNNYERGDCIFLFGALEQYVTCMSMDTERSTGFSRGAYQVRVLSAMIDKVCYVLRALAAPIDVFAKIKVGLIRNGSGMQIEQCAYNILYLIIR